MKITRKAVTLREYKIEARRKEIMAQIEYNEAQMRRMSECNRDSNCSSVTLKNIIPLSKKDIEFLESVT